MAHKSTFVVPFRRRKEGKTNYAKRIGMLRSGLPRLVVRKTSKHIIAQFAQFDPAGDKTLVHVNSRRLESFGWKAGKKNLPAAYLTGLLAGVKAKGKKVDSAILDIGFAMPHLKGWWASALKGAIDAGIKIPVGENTLPSEDRISGKHIELAFKNPKKHALLFSEASKKADLQNLSKEFADVKQKILSHGGKDE